MIEALIFDFDGLILDTETPMRRSWMEIYAEHGLSVSAETWIGHVGSSADPAAAYALLEQHLGRPIDRDAVRVRRAVRERELLEREDILPGVRRIIEDAGTHGLRLAVASSSERAWVVEHLASFRLIESFDAVVCADDVSRTKPAPDLYREALRRLEVYAERAMAFEDSPHGVTAAKAAGLYCVAIPNAVTRHATFAVADCVLASLADCTLADLLDSANRSAG